MLPRAPAPARRTVRDQERSPVFSECLHQSSRQRRPPHRRRDQGRETGDVAGEGQGGSGPGSSTYSLFPITWSPTVIRNCNYLDGLISDSILNGERKGGEQVPADPDAGHVVLVQHPLTVQGRGRWAKRREYYRRFAMSSGAVVTASFTLIEADPKREEGFVRKGFRAYGSEEFSVSLEAPNRLDSTQTTQGSFRYRANWRTESL